MIQRAEHSGFGLLWRVDPFLVALYVAYEKMGVGTQSYQVHHPPTLIRTQRLGIVKGSRTKWAMSWKAWNRKRMGRGIQMLEMGGAQEEISVPAVSLVLCFWQERSEPARGLWQLREGRVFHILKLTC